MPTHFFDQIGRNVGHYFCPAVTFSSNYDKKADLCLGLQVPTMNETSKVIARTNRLLVREMTLQDLDFLAALHQDKRVMKYIGPRRTHNQVKNRLLAIIKAYHVYPGYGIWMACIKDTDESIGWICLKDLDGSEHVEIGYRLASRYWDRGYATELSKAMLQLGFQTHGLSYIAAVTNSHNKASARVLLKVGLTYIGPEHYYNADLDFFKITKEEWEAIDSKIF